MVAASKLRRAQEAAEAARPYAERMAGILASLAAGQNGAENAPRLLVGTGKDQVHLLVVATAERGLCGAFNRSEEHTSELQSLMRNSYAVFCLKKKKQISNTQKHTSHNTNSYIHSHNRRTLYIKS